MNCIALFQVISQNVHLNIQTETLLVFLLSHFSEDTQHRCWVLTSRWCCCRRWGLRPRWWSSSLVRVLAAGSVEWAPPPAYASLWVLPGSGMTHIHQHASDSAYVIGLWCPLVITVKVVNVVVPWFWSQGRPARCHAWPWRLPLCWSRSAERPDGWDCPPLDYYSIYCSSASEEPSSLKQTQNALKAHAVVHITQSIYTIYNIINNIKCKMSIDYILYLIILLNILKSLINNNNNNN